MADVHVDGAVERRGLAIIEILHQGVAGEHASGVAHEQLEDIELEGGELDRAAVDDDGARAGVEQDAADLDAAAGRDRARLVAAQDGADARDQLAWVEGLRKVIVGAELKADDAVYVLTARGQHDDRNLASGAEAAENFEAVDA